MARPIAAAFCAVVLLAAPVFGSAAKRVDKGEPRAAVGACRVWAASRPVFAGHVAQGCSDAVQRIGRRLRVDAPTAPIDVYVVESPHALQQAAPPGARIPRWAAAVAFPAHGRIVIPVYQRHGMPDDWRRTLDHEVAHILYHRASGGAPTPRWWSEGLAIVLSEPGSHWRSPQLWWASLTGRVPRLRDIARYPVHDTAAQTAYAFAADFLAYLVTHGGWAAIASVTASLRSGVPFERAFAQGMGAPVAHWEQRWRSRVFDRWGMDVQTSDILWMGVAVLVFFFAGWLWGRRLRRARGADDEVDTLFEQARRAVGATDAGGEKGRRNGDGGQRPDAD